MPNTSLVNTAIYRFNEQSGTPSTPAAGYSGIYMKSDGLYTIDDAGLVTGPITTAATIILAPATSVRNIILPTAGDYIPLTLRGYASAQTASLLEIKEGSAGTIVHSMSGTGKAIFQNFTDSTTGFQIFDKDGGTPIFNIDTTNERVGIGTVAPSVAFDLVGSAKILPPTDIVPITIVGHSSAASKIIVAQEGTATTEVFSLSGTGAATFQNFTDSATGFRILDKDGGTAILQVNTTNELVGIGTAPSKPLHVVAAIDPLNISDAAVFVSATWTPPDTDPQWPRGLNVYANISGSNVPTSGYVTGIESNAQSLSTAVQELRSYTALLRNVSVGVVPAATSYYAHAPTLTGSATYTNIYGLYVEDFLVGSTGNYSLYTNAGDIVFNAANGAGNVTVGGTPVSANYDLGLVGDGVLMQKETTTPTADAGYGKTYTQSDNKLYFQDGAGDEHIVHGFPSFKSYTGTTQGLGVSPDIYLGGFYYAPVADANLTQGSTTQAYGNANVSYAAHAFIVAGNAGSVDTGVVGLRITGTTITDGGTRATGQTVVLSADITTLETNLYLETTEKWLGTITYELYVVSGSPTTYSLDFNYGLAKYEDWGNNDFTVTEVEATGLAGANDSDFDICIIRHSDTGWVYSAAAFDPMVTVGSLLPRVFYSLVTNHATDDQLIATQPFAWKLTGLGLFVEGSSTAGYILCLSSSANNAIEYCNIHVGIEY